MTQTQLNAAEPAPNPVSALETMLIQAGWLNFKEKNYWERTLCSLVLTLEPNCKPQRLIDSLPLRGKRLDDVDVYNVMAHLGYFQREADVSLENIDQRLLPCLFVPDRARAAPIVVLKYTDEGLLELYNPIQNTTMVLKKNDSRMGLSGKAHFFQPYDENLAATSKFRRAGTGYSWFRSVLTRFHSTFWQIFISGLALNILALATPIFIMLVYDRVIAANMPAVLPMLALGAVIAILFEDAIRHNRSQGLSWVASRLDNIVSNKIFAHMIGLPTALVERASVAAQIARMKTFESVRDFFSGSAFLSLVELPFVVISLIAIAFIAGPLVFVPIFMGACFAALFYLSLRYVRTTMRLAAKASSARQQFTIETFEKIEGIRTYGLDRKWMEKFRHLSGREMVFHFRLGMVGMIAETASHTLTVLSAVLTIGFGAEMIWKGDMGTGSLVATMILVWRVLTPFYSLCTMIPRLEQIRNSIIQVNSLMDIGTEAMEARAASRLPRLQGKISFQNVKLFYGSEADLVFNDLDFEAKAGDFVVVSGRNGSGKTSLLKLIKALYAPKGGVIRVDGFDIRQLDAPDLRRQIAYVPQKPDFFAGTISENLRIANPLATAEEIEAALKYADAWAEISALPSGLSTVLGGEGNDGLSSGLATRLSIARAYLHPGNVLLIDELPNTLLTGIAGKNLKDYIARMKGQKTVIMVTYREDFMKLADLVILLQGHEQAVVNTYAEVSKIMEKAA